MEKEVKFTQIQTNVVNMESLGSNMFRSLESVQPFLASEKTVIPAGTHCVISGDKDIFIHWDFSVSIWHVVKEILYRWSQKVSTMGSLLETHTSLQICYIQTSLIQKP